MRNRDMPAKPLTGNVQINKEGFLAEGLTKLETATIAAMQGILASPKNIASYQATVNDAINCANKLFDELEKDQ